MQIPLTHSLGIQNAWWFSLIYGIASISIMIFISKERRKRILSFPKFNTKMEKIFSGLALFIFGRGLIVYSFFIPLKLMTVNFIIGTIIYLIGMVSSIYAMWTFSRADLSEPVTGGIFKITRHPMQVMGIVMWIGVGIGCWYFLKRTL